jgi:sec-independent protein translocase protein TatB
VFNLPTGGEFLIILLVALIVLGPEKLPDAVRKFGRLYGELRRMANGFTSELRDAMDEGGGGLDEMRNSFTEPLRSLRDTAEEARRSFFQAAEPPVISPGQVIDQSTPIAGPDVVLPGEPVTGEESVTGEEPVDTAAVTEPDPVDPSGEHGLVELDDPTTSSPAEPTEG